MSPKVTLPSVENVRLATLSDLPRIASVAAAGFFWSPTFQFQRPHYNDFPEDTLSSYWREYQAMIVDPACVVVVTEDVLDPNESECVYEAMQKCHLHRPGTIPQFRVVVGVCSIDLGPCSSLMGLQASLSGSRVETTEVCALLSNLNRDQNEDAVKLYAETTGPAKSRYLGGQMRLGTLAVHPAYWRRGHATCLVRWCTGLADMEGVAVGVSATPMGAILAVQAGFEGCETVRIQRPISRNGCNGGDVELWIGVRPPSRSPSNASTASPGSPVPEMQRL